MADYLPGKQLAAYGIVKLTVCQDEEGDFVRREERLEKLNREPRK
jgi:hypothetical protein